MIQTKHLRLWPLEHQDLVKNYQWANDMELCRYAGALPLPRSLNDLEGWYNTTMSDPETSVFSIKLNDGAYIGNIEIRNLDLRCANCELGIMIGQYDMRRKGYGQEAVIGLCSFIFQELRLHRITVRVLEYNDIALKLFQKCGFVLEGVERQSFWSQGQYWDVRVLGLLEDDFKRVQAELRLAEEKAREEQTRQEQVEQEVLEEQKQPTEADSKQEA